MAAIKRSNDSTAILSSFLDAFSSSESSATPTWNATIHQKALFLCWCIGVFAWLVRSLTKYLIPGRYLSFNAGIPSPPPKITQRPVIEKLEEGDATESEATKARDSKGPANAEPPSFDALLHAIIILGLIMYFFYACDYAHVFPKANRTYSRDLFILLTLVLFLVAGAFTVKEGDGKVLNRYQTEEWKGWMQVMFVWYHYFKAAELYNAIRIFIAAYVWMTGFGNFSFFWIRRDYSINRMLKMLFRLNFLVIIVTFVTNNQYMLYYICPMHTFWFLTVYAMMKPWEHLNENRKIMAIKFTIYAAVVFIVFDFGVGKFCFAPLTFVLGYDGSLHEWLFRSGLDHYATFFGMICAYNYPNFERFLAYVERETVTARDNIIKYGLKIGVATFLAITVVIWYNSVYVLGKYEYNKLHPYTSIIPIITYIYFRNLAPKLRKKYVSMFSWLGRITLETYISQLHIYMQGNAKLLIVYIHGYPLLNFAISTVIYLFLSYHLFNITGILSAYLLPKQTSLQLQRIGVSSILISISYFIVILTTPYSVLHVVSTVN